MTDEREELGRRRYFELQALARRQGRDTQELLTLYALEGWLARLAATEHRGTLVLKGGMLLAAFDQRRPTRDLDLHARQLAGDAETVRALVAEIAAVPVDDGLTFDGASASAQPIREGDAYHGVRVSVDATLHTAGLTPKVDVNVGDPIWPAPQEIELPRLLGGQPLRLRGYPLPMVLAEKLVTAVARGTLVGDRRGSRESERWSRGQSRASRSSCRSLAPHPAVLVLRGTLRQSSWRYWPTSTMATGATSFGDVGGLR